MPNFGPHITVTQNTLVVQLSDDAEAVDFQLDDQSKPLTNGTCYGISGKTNRIKLTISGGLHMYLDLAGTDQITFTDQARLIVTGSLT